MPYKDAKKQKEYLKKRNKKLRKEKAEKLKTRRKERIKWLQSLKKEKVCEICGEGDSVCLDYHHKNEDEKFKGIHRMAHAGYSKKRILEEIKKCKIVCANCHRRIHSNKWYL